MPKLSRESAMKWGRLKEMKNKHLTSPRKIWQSRGRGRRKQTVKEIDATEADVDVSGLSNSQGSPGCFSPVFPSWSRSSTSFPSPTPLAMAKRGLWAASIQNHKSQSNPWTMQLGWQLSDEPAGRRADSGLPIGPVERGVFRLRGQCGHIGFISWAYPTDRRWLPGTSRCSLAPWSNSDVCYGQRMKEGSICAMYLNLTLDRIKSPLPFSQAPSPQRMCSDLAKIMCQTLCQMLYLY